MPTPTFEEFHELVDEAKLRLLDLSLWAKLSSELVPNKGA